MDYMPVDLLQPSQHESLLDLLCELHAHYNNPPTATRTEVRGHLLDNLLDEKSGLHLLVATDGQGVVIGFAALALLYSLVEPGPGQRRQCLLKELFVHSSARGEGVGEALICQSAHFALANGCGRMDWNVKATNTRGIAFYEALGASCVDDRLSFRLDREQLAQLAGSR